MSLFHKEIRDGLYHIGDGRGNFCTLITGSSGAVLFDTMLGFDDLKGYVSELTQFEPMVINSHFHFDHIGGNHQFGRVYMHGSDLPLMELGLNRIPVLTETLESDLSRMKCCYTELDKISPIEDGDVINLGERTVQVIALPGHTPGSIGLLLREERILLAGDALSPQYCIFFQESMPLEQSVQTISMLWNVPFDFFLSSHFDFQFPKSVLKKFEACFELPKKKKGMIYGYPLLPEEHGRFFVLSPCDPEIGQLIGVAVKDSDVEFLTKGDSKVK